MSERLPTNEEVQVYELASSRLFIVAVVFAIAVSLVPLALALSMARAFRDHPVVWVSCAAFLGLPLLMWLRASANLVPGGKGQLQVTRFGVDLVTAKGSTHFPLGELCCQVTTYKRRIRKYFITIATFTTVHVRLQAEGQSQLLSHRLFENIYRMQAFVDDVNRIRAGQPPLGVTCAAPLQTPETRSVQAPTTAVEASDVVDDSVYEAQLDAELAALDP